MVWALFSKNHLLNLAAAVKETVDPMNLSFEAFWGGVSLVMASALAYKCYSRKQSKVALNEKINQAEQKYMHNINNSVSSVSF
jgi:hypothetical protein